MSIRRRRSGRSGRAPLASPGRPSVAGRGERSRFWLAIAAGMSSEDAAVTAGVSQPVGARWFRQAGGISPAMFRSSAKPLSGRYLSLEEREEIALLLVQSHSMREIGRRLGRSASTISRELRRNAATRSGGLEYRATTAQWHADRSARRPKPSKLALNPTLRTYVEERLAGVMKRTFNVSDKRSLWPRQVALPFPGLSCRGRAVGMALDRGGDGRRPGDRSRLPGAWPSTSRTIGRCASATKPSTRRCSSRAAARCAGSLRRVCEPGGSCGCRALTHAGAARASLRRRS